MPKKLKIPTDAPNINLFSSKRDEVDIHDIPEDELTKYQKRLLRLEAKTKREQKENAK